MEFMFVETHLLEIYLIFLSVLQIARTTSISMHFQRFSGILGCGFIACLGQQHSGNKLIFCSYPLTCSSSVGSTESY